MPSQSLKKSSWQPLDIDLLCDNSCKGSIVNLVAFAGGNCSTTTDTSAANDSPPVSLTKFSAVPGGSGTTYRSGCKRIIESDQALSIIYTSDGANQRKCNLDLYTTSRCTGNNYVRRSLNEDVSECENVQATYARVVCTA
jgi:hypothetical protein